MTRQNTTSSLKETHKDLYGLLMLVNQRIDNVGTSLIWILILGVIAACVSIHMRWFDAVLGIPVEKLRGFGVYTLMAIAAFLVFVVVTEFREKRIYHAAKPEILEMLRQNDLSVEALLADIANDKNVDKIKDKLLDDKQLQEPGPMQFG